ncbi:hypothetical protein EAH79_11530 [Sphingomonas koreensis]|nr:hypothetical protein EAH79_11530 [Sphingomonas koreensis]
MGRVSSSRKAGHLVLDGPFIESKEHFVGFYVVDCDDLGAQANQGGALPFVPISADRNRPLRTRQHGPVVHRTSL